MLKKQSKFCGLGIDLIFQERKLPFSSCFKFWLGVIYAWLSRKLKEQVHFCLMIQVRDKIKCLINRNHMKSCDSKRNYTDVEPNPMKSCEWSNGQLKMDKNGFRSKPIKWIYTKGKLGDFWLLHQFLTELKGDQVKFLVLCTQRLTNGQAPKSSNY